MHETSLIEFTLNAVEDKARSMGMDHVKNIHLTVGAMRGAIPALMQEAFTIMIHGKDIFRGATLEIDENPIKLRCTECGRIFMTREFSGIKCPGCGESKYNILSGNELRIDYFEGDDQPEQ